MATDPAIDYTAQLRQLMQLSGISTFKQLSQQAGVSEQQILHLRRGRLRELRVATLARLSQVLQVAIADLLVTFVELDERANQETAIGGAVSGATVNINCQAEAATGSTLTFLEQEYQRLQLQLAEQHQQLWQEFQQTSLQTLEPWLLQWSAAVYAAQQNPQLPAVKLLPLLRPIEQLLQQWEITAFVTVGAEIPYDPQWHQLMGGLAAPGDRVRVRYAGYRQGEKLLFRAKVSPIEG
jgi:DNA-binding Xre family transcriptional regulator